VEMFSRTINSIFMAENIDSTLSVKPGTNLDLDKKQRDGVRESRRNKETSAKKGQAFRLMGVKKKLLRSAPNWARGVKGRETKGGEEIPNCPGKNVYLWEKKYRQMTKKKPSGVAQKKWPGLEPRKRRNRWGRGEKTGQRSSGRGGG